jgi:hypothetical protein
VVVRVKEAERVAEVQVNDIDGVRIYSRSELLMLLQRASDVLGDDILDALPDSMTLDELEKLVNSQN